MAAPPEGSIDRVLDFARYAVAAAAVAPGTLLSVARGRMEPQIGEGTDFGGLRRSEHRVAMAGSREELRSLLAKAARQGEAVTVAGSRHSANGQTLPRAGGLQIRLDRASGRWAAPTMVGPTRVRVSAVHTWRSLQAWLRPRGRSCPVLTDHLTTTIGGTLSVGGGIGTASVAWGRQLDQVRAFRLVLPDGDEAWCSPEENADLFRHAMGGFGELGVIDEVELETRPHRPWLAIFRYQHRDLPGAMDLVRQALEHPAVPGDLAHLVVEGPILDTPFLQFELGLEADSQQQARDLLRDAPEAFAHLERSRRVLGHRAIVKADQSNDRHNRSASYVSSLVGYKHIWNDFFFADYDSFRRFLCFTRDEVFARRGCRHLMSGLSFAYPGDPLDPVDPAHRRAAFSFPARQGERYRWSFGFNYSVPPGPQVQPIIETVATLRREATALGAGLYGYGYAERTAAELRQAYGSVVDDFLALKARVDPSGRFGAGLPLR